jgi:hypothetical protein
MKSVLRLGRLIRLQPDNRSHNLHPGIMRFQVVLHEMPRGAQRRLEVGLTTVLPHKLVGGTPDVRVRNQFSRPGLKSFQVLAQFAVRRNPPKGLTAAVELLDIEAKPFYRRQIIR